MSPGYVLSYPSSLKSFVSKFLGVKELGSTRYASSILKVLATTLLTQSKGFINSGAAARLAQESHWESESKPLLVSPNHFLRK